MVARNFSLQDLPYSRLLQVPDDEREFLTLDELKPHQLTELGVTSQQQNNKNHEHQQNIITSPHQQHTSSHPQQHQHQQQQQMHEQHQESHQQPSQSSQNVVPQIVVTNSIQNQNYAGGHLHSVYYDLNTQQTIR